MITFDHRLVHGTVYTFKLRVSDGHRWSAWTEYSPPMQAWNELGDSVFNGRWVVLGLNGAHGLNWMKTAYRQNTSLEGIVCRIYVEWGTGV